MAQEAQGSGLVRVTQFVLTETKNGFRVTATIQPEPDSRWVETFAGILDPDRLHGCERPSLDGTTIVVLIPDSKVMDAQVMIRSVVALTNSLFAEGE